MNLGRILLVGLLLPVLAAAEGDVDATGERLVAGFVNDVRTLAGRFEQSLLDAGGQVLEVTSGALEIRRPGQFRWSYVEPYEQILVADGVNMWSYDVDLAQVTVKPQAQALSNTPALLLGGSAAALEQFTYVGAEIAKGATWVTLEPRDTESGFLRVEMGFANEQLDRMIFYDNLEQTTVVALHDLTINEPIADDRFVFEIPEDVDVVGSPAIAEATQP